MKAETILRSHGVHLAVGCLKATCHRNLAELEADCGTDDDDGTIQERIDEAEAVLRDLDAYLAYVNDPATSKA